MPLNRPAILNRVSAAAAQTLDRRTAPRLPAHRPRPRWAFNAPITPITKGVASTARPQGNPSSPGLSPQASFHHSPLRQNLPPGHRHFQPPSAAPQTARHLSSRITAAPRCRCPAEPLGLWPPGGGGERATSGGWSRAPPSTAWGVHLGRSRHRAESLGLFCCFPCTNFGGCPSSHHSNKHGGWGGDLSLRLGPCGGDNPLPLATRPFSDLGSKDERVMG